VLGDMEANATEWEDVG